MPYQQRPPETFEQQEKDAKMIFTQITTGDFHNYKQAEEAIVFIYVPDLTISRSGIARAMKMLERHYAEEKKSD